MVTGSVASGDRSERSFCLPTWPSLRLAHHFVLAHHFSLHPSSGYLCNRLEPKQQSTESNSVIGWVFEKPRRPFPRHTQDPPVLAQAHAPTHRCSCQLGVGCLHGTISGQNLQTWNMEVRMLLLLLVANLGSVRAQEKPRLGRDGRPLLNKPKVGHAAFYQLHLRHIQSIHVKQYPSNSAVKNA